LPLVRVAVVSTGAAVAALREGAAPVCTVTPVAVRVLFLAVSSVVAVVDAGAPVAVVVRLAAGVVVRLAAGVVEPVEHRPLAAAVAAGALVAAAALRLVSMSLKSGEGSTPSLVTLSAVTSVVASTGAKVPSSRALVGVAAATVVPATPVFSSALEGGAVTDSFSANCRGCEL